MPRPIKQGFDYFSLDTDFFQNKSINALRRLYGSVGVLVYLNLLCRIYRNGYFISFDDIEELSMDIAEEIASAPLGRVSASVSKVINYLVDRGTFDRALFEKYVISGEKIQEQYVIASYRAKRNIRLGVHSLVDADVVIRNFRQSSEKKSVSSEKMAINSKTGTHSNSYSNNTTTTSQSICMPPTMAQISAYFCGESDMEREESFRQASAFFAYNDGRGWDCLPHWRVAAQRWCERMIEYESKKEN